MKTRLPSFAVILAAATLAGGAAMALAQKEMQSLDIEPAETDPPVGIAIVELYTSQGCSSCPSADLVLRELKATAAESKLPIYPLSFHVDYWNNLGWPDPYSEDLFTRRQRAYATAMGSQRVYTPQMIVNGRVEFVGSDRAKARKVVEHALKQKAEVEIELNVKPDSPMRQVTVAYRLKGPIEGRYLNIALVDNPAANEVPNGENAGRTLQHANVVRALRPVAIANAEGSVEFELPEDVAEAAWQVVAFVQDPQTLAIVGATAK
ncbi:DUF1223 domain-containing protein [Bremerella sp. JC817]|uniref:DUF1223 domain-containing protein n=1 Tax=Bremerella sp. JC817 TaxID=3231756 RepID=UPI003459DE7D